MGVRIDQSGMHQAMPRIDHSGIVGRCESRAPYFCNRVATYQYVDGNRLVPGDIEQLATAKHGVDRGAGHGDSVANKACPRQRKNAV
jgi:hypothetical protein